MTRGAITGSTKNTEQHPNSERHLRFRSADPKKIISKKTQLHPGSLRTLSKWPRHPTDDAGVDRRALGACRPRQWGAEQSWSSGDGRVVVNYVIDRIFVADDYRRTIHYKAVRALAADLPACAEQFRARLARYAGLFALTRGADVLPLRLALLFGLQRVLVDLPC
jgi:hypothetical protein